MNLKSGNIIKKPAPVLAIGDAGHHAVQQEKERGNDESVKKYFCICFTSPVLQGLSTQAERKK